MITTTDANAWGEPLGLPEAPDAAWLCIDLLTDKIIASGVAMSVLLGVEESALPGEAWQTLLGGEQLDPLLSQAVTAGVRSALPPVVIQRPDGNEFIASGKLLPRAPGPGDSVILFLWPVQDDLQQQFVAQVGRADTLAVLGMEQVKLAAHWHPQDTTRLMMDVRSSLLDILRSEDEVGLPVGSAITVIFRDTGIGGAQDMSRALLSHLRSIERGSNHGLNDVQLCIGLAHLSAGACTSPLRTLLAANRAVQQAQHHSGAEPIRVAGDSDAVLIGARALHEHGVFSENRVAPKQRDYLARLLRLTADKLAPDELLWALIELTLGQTAVLACAIYQRKRDGVFAYVAGGLNDTSHAGTATEDELPRVFRDQRRRIDYDYLEQAGHAVQGKSGMQVMPLRGAATILGYVMIQHEIADQDGPKGFLPDVAALYGLTEALSGLPGWRENSGAARHHPAPLVTPMETGIDGYVGDNMEGAVDQAMFLARLDVAIAIIGPRGTGKLYVARIIHQESGAAPDMLVEIDCREFHSRKQALARIATELSQGEGRTLVFKSAHLMNADAQIKLARQISTRMLADVNPPRYLPKMKLIALFPEELEKLVRQEKLTPQLASAFAGYPIRVPPIKDRKQAVLRWAHKILGQECALRERYVRGFTPDAEQAMFLHDWPGNISEMRQCIVDALDKTDKEWVTPVDLGIFKGLSADSAPPQAEVRPFLAVMEEDSADDDDYIPSAFEALDVALGEAVNNLLALNSIRPLGTWLEDEVVLSVCDRYGNDTRGAADFLHTKPRNVSRWLPKIEAREEQRHNSSLWQDSRRLVQEWIRESGQAPESPLRRVEDVLMSHVSRLAQALSVADRARIMGVSVPTYHKRSQERD